MSAKSPVQFAEVAEADRAVRSSGRTPWIQCVELSERQSDPGVLYAEVVLCDGLRYWLRNARRSAGPKTFRTVDAAVRWCRARGFVGPIVVGAEVF